MYVMSTHSAVVDIIPKLNIACCYVQIDNAPKGSVIFISGPTDGPNALWGDLMSTAAAAQGLRGAVVDGRVRDIRGLREVGVPVSFSYP